MIWAWFGECLECYSSLPSPGRGSLLHTSPFYSVGVCVCPGKCRPVRALRDTHWAESAAHCSTDEGCGKFTLVFGHQREPWQAWFIPGIFPRSHSGSSERERVCLHIKAQPELSVESSASAMFISHSFSVSLLQSQCLFISVQWILAQSGRRRKTVSVKNSSDSLGKRWWVYVGGQVWLPDIFCFTEV